MAGGNNKNPAFRMSPGWRNYQRELRRERNIRRCKKLVIGAFLFAPVLSLIVYAIYTASEKLPEIFQSIEKEAAKQEAQTEKIFSGKRSLRKILGEKSFLNLRKKRFPVSAGAGFLWVDTSIDLDLQQFLLEIMNISHARQIGMVAMDPADGRILAMVGYDREDEDNNPCLDNQFPAASIFKIVTAAGAIEKFNLRDHSPLVYNGNKYTLYKSQLKNTLNKYTRRVTLEESFAESINPVFGKLGILKLKKTNLQSYGEALGFNKDLEFELPLKPSNLEISEEPYNWAEVACGFNRQTTLSPLHGAMITAAVLNEGKLPMPAIVEKILQETGETVYEYKPSVIQRAFKKETSAILNDLMQATVKSGTGRKIFRGYTKDQTLSRLSIGGKTGSINDKSHEARIDWFVGFAEDQKSSRRMVVSIVVAHQDYIGVRAGQYARKAFTYYFQNYFAQEERKTG